MEEWMDHWLHGWKMVDGWMDGQVGRWMDGSTVGWKDHNMMDVQVGWKKEWMDG